MEAITINSSIWLRLSRFTVNDVHQLTGKLARRVLGWKTAPNRYIVGNRKWLPTWRFQPTKNIADAFRVLDAADVVEYVLRADRNGIYRVKVWTRRASAEASGPSLPLTICIAIARVLHIDLEARD
jgi:hypothetical protein